jgi:hypothetical protein
VLASLSYEVEVESEVVDRGNLHGQQFLSLEEMV